MALKSSYLLRYENQWVAVSTKNEVIAAGKTINIVQKKLGKLKNKSATLLKVLPFNSSYSPNAI